MLNSTMDSSVDFVLPDLASSPLKINKSRELPPRPAVVEASITSIDNSAQLLGLRAVNIDDHIERPSKKQKKNYLTVDGKIDMKTMREGKAKIDKFYVGSKAILKKAEEIHKTTGAAITVSIKPLTDRGQEKKYISPNFASFVPKKTLTKKNTNAENEETIPYEEIEDDNQPAERSASVATPRKKLGCSREIAWENYDKNRCNICKAIFNSSQDQIMNSIWIRCAIKGCKFWVHSKCSNVFFKNSKELQRWAREHFFCPSHIPDEDEDSSSEDDEVKQNKRHLKAAIKKKGQK